MWNLVEYYREIGGTFGGWGARSLSGGEWARAGSELEAGICVLQKEVRRRKPDLLPTWWSRGELNPDQVGDEPLGGTSPTPPVSVITLASALKIFLITFTFLKIYLFCS